MKNQKLTAKKHWFAFWTSFSWRTECNKNKSRIQRICNELQSRISWENELEATKSSIKDLFRVLLNETKGFKYLITLKVLLKKDKPNGKIEFRPVYFNSTIKTVINHRFNFENLLQDW